MKRYTKSIMSNITPPHAHTLGLDCFIDESYPLFKNQITSMLTNCLWAWHKLNDTSERAVCFKTPSSVCATIDANTQQVNILRTEQAVQFDSVWKEKHIKDKLGFALWTQRSRSEKPSVSGDHTQRRGQKACHLETRGTFTDDGKRSASELWGRLRCYMHTSKLELYA